ncbi:MAG: phosphate signaling complex protein PhoU [Clostridiales bacterium]|nr:phosphate signaling complex protein PhoU [Clostridiales bacterium]
MSRTNFDEELKLMHLDIIKMGALIEEAIKKSIKVLEPEHRDLASEVEAGDKNIDALEKLIEARCLKLLLRQQPVARDLRAISTAIKMITDMERIGDQASDIADIAARPESASITKFAVHIPVMCKIATEMVSASIKSFIDSDLEYARATMLRDDEVDDLFDIVKKELIENLKTGTFEPDAVINAMMIAKYLERIGDHAVNICEWVEFYITGVHKHTKIL